MKIKNAKFLISSPNLKLCPEYNLAEFALLGRSNVGKSTFINTLTNRKNLKQVFMLVDFRHGLTNDDIMMYNFLKYYKLPVTIVATKVDKIGITKHQQQRNSILNDLDMVVGDEFVMFSNVTKVGKEDIHQKIERTI